MAGFTAVPLNPQNRKQEYEGCFSQFRIKAIIVQKGFTTAAMIAAQERAIPLIELLPVGQKAGIFALNPEAEQHQKEAKFATPHDISHIFLTSGTTASPKIVPVSQKQSYISRQRNFRPSQISQTDRCLHIVPYYHAAGIGAPLLSILLAGGTVICTKEFIPSDFPHLLKTCRPTLYSAGPALHGGYSAK
jgi:acyl-CoA synthetase (AMP-forming)/AMP-acid ligase II